MKQFILSILLLLTLTVSAQVQLYQYKGVVTEVQDGDTFHSMTSLGFDVYKDVTIRLAKINAPEMKGTDSIAARKAKDYLTKKLLGKTIYFNSKAYDKYHRSIAIVYLSATDTATINNDLVRKGFAKYQSY
jgi:endonuclease YncB( thermonuclease family)